MLLGQENIYADMLAAHTDYVGMYFLDLETGSSLTVQETSTIMDEYGWAGGWRAADTEAQDIWFAGCPDNCLFQVLGKSFVLNAFTMKIHTYNPLGVEGILEAAQEIDKDN